MSDRSYRVPKSMRRRAALLLPLCLACSGSPTDGGDGDPVLGAAFVDLDVSYCGTDPAQRLDLYFPAGGGVGRPLVVHVHGGGWQRGDKATGPWFTRVGRALIDAGYVVASVNYRLAPQHRWPAQIEDVKCAIRFLRARASTAGYDGSRIGVWGNSAGGHLVSQLGVTDAGDGFEGSDEFGSTSSRVQAVVPLYGAADLTTDDWPLVMQAAIQVTFGVLPDPGQAVLVAGSPVTHVSADDPPFFIVHGVEDRVILPNQSQALLDRLRGSNVTATFLMVANADHELVPSGGSISPSEDQITRDIVAFYDGTL